MAGGTGDADMYVKFGSAPTDTVYDCRPYVSGNAETCTIATAQAGTYYVRLKAYSSYSGVSLTGSYTPPGGGGGGTQVYTNDTDVAIPDRGHRQQHRSSSAAAAATRRGNSKATVQVTHPYRGELAVTLIAPDGIALHAQARAARRTTVANIDAIYTVNLVTRGAQRHLEAGSRRHLRATRPAR